MELTYEAILKGNKLEWLGAMPKETHGTKPLHVRIVVLEGASSQPRRPDPKAAAAALERMAAMGGVKSISDPVAWQRETRKDRPLPGREP